MKAFAVFWKKNINEGTNLPYVGSAVVIAPDFEGAMNIAKTYGEISSIHSENDHVITEAKQVVDTIPEPEGQPV